MMALEDEEEEESDEPLVPPFPFADRGADDPIAIVETDGWTNVHPRARSPTRTRSR
ncbi:hypothetical protein [Microbacterium sp. NIBRBAC000506063]|uniref:hypothetical protein n=1 Tax=Microbacterium sp. NIBRBAC000506063 TaxID=2734618 RepID=UPI001BB71661|nr:hypothetical protein [Microbacterium sp. NIBRBAC000506063]QTV78953.1 hypothetical protein KAE78_07045 [Microbacterium sp. NIBRBAC000506063]